MMLYPKPKNEKRKSIKNGVSYTGKISSYFFCFNIFHRNKIFGFDVATKFYPPHSHIPKNIKKFLELYYLQKEFWYLKADA